MDCFGPNLDPRFPARTEKEAPQFLRETIREFAKYLQYSFAEEIEYDPSLFRKRVIHLLKTALPSPHGRPRLKIVSIAADMRAQGKSWLAVYTACIPALLAGDSRQLAQSRLRSAVRARRRRFNQRLRRQVTR